MTRHETDTRWGWPLFMAFIRVPLIVMASAAIILILQSAGFRSGTVTGAEWATLSVTITNIVCLGLLLWRARVEGFRLSDLVGFERSRLLGDFGWGLLWSMGLYALMIGGIVVMWLVIQGLTGMTFEQIFMGDADFTFDVPRWMTVALAIVSGVAFPLLNAPIEELQYRGYAQPRLIAAAGSAWPGIGIQAAGFGLQHAAFAYTLSAAPLLVVGFFIWGFGAGLIANRQKRLMPLIVAHFISNLSFGIVPLVFMLSGA